MDASWTCVETLVGRPNGKKRLALTCVKIWPWLKPWSNGLASSRKWTQVFNLRLLATPFGKGLNWAPSHRKSTQGLAKRSRTQVDPSFQLSSTCDSVWPGLYPIYDQNLRYSLPHFSMTWKKIRPKIRNYFLTWPLHQNLVSASSKHVEGWENSRRDVVKRLHNFLSNFREKCSIAFIKLFLKMRANLKRHNCVYMLSSKHTYQPVFSVFYNSGTEN